MTRIIITKTEFLDKYEANELNLKTLIVTPIAIIVKSLPAKDKPETIYIVNIP